MGKLIGAVFWSIAMVLVVVGGSELVSVSAACLLICMPGCLLCRHSHERAGGCRQQVGDKAVVRNKLLFMFVNPMLPETIFRKIAFILAFLMIKVKVSCKNMLK